MNKTKVETLIKRIDKAFRELAKETGAKHISAYLIDDATSVEDYTNLSNPKFQFYKNDIVEDLNIYE